MPTVARWSTERGRFCGLIACGHATQGFHQPCATGHYKVVGTGLRRWTEATTRTDKVAEYVATQTPLAEVGEPTLDFTNTTGGGVPGFQVVVDFDNDGIDDGILIGDPGSYGNDWRLNKAAQPFVRAGAPVSGDGSGSSWHGTLAQWRSSFPDALRGT